MARRQAAVLRRRDRTAARLAAGTGGAALTGQSATGEPGSLILGPEELGRLRENLARYPWYRDVYDGFSSRVDELIIRRPAVPVAKGRAFFESCESCSARLDFDPYDQSSHRCPRCGREHHGEAFDLAWLRQFHDWLGKRLVEAGIVYRVDGDECCAQLVRHYLCHYVTHYRDYPLANNLLGPTRLFQSTYLEAFWLVDMVAAFDLTRGSRAYSEADLLGVRELLFESAAVVRSYDEGRSNRQAFNNAGMGAVGLLFGDEDLIEHVLTGPHGFAFHMRESLLEDGIWYEGENYHFATLDHTLNLAEMARHRGIDLYGGGAGHGSLRPMFDGPLKVMLPDLTFPSRKDSWFGRGMEFHRQVYELGYARYASDRYGGLLADCYASGVDRRDMSWRTFLYLEPELPELTGGVSDVRPLGSEEMPGTGVAVLRTADGADYASLEYGHYGGGHGHPDRLHLTLFAGGVHWLLDPGTGWYHVKELGWYRSTIAHNTLSVDGLLQLPREGRLVAFGDTGGFKAAQATVAGLAPGVSARRTLVLGPGFLVDVLDVLADAGQQPEGDDRDARPPRPDTESPGRQVDWAFHTVGHFQMTAGSPAAVPMAPASLGERDGYEFLRDPRRAESTDVDLLVQHGDASLRVIQPGDSTLILAEAPGVPGHEEHALSTLVARRSLTYRTRFVTAWIWSPAKDGARFLTVTPDQHVLELGEDRITVDVAPFDRLEVKGVAVTRGRRSTTPDAAAGRGTVDAVAWFGLRRLALPGAAVEADRALPFGSVVRQHDGTWKPHLPDGFGSLDVTTDEQLRFEQPRGVELWRDTEDVVTLSAGMTSDVRFSVGTYGLEPAQAAEPEVMVPDGWRVIALVPDRGPQAPSEDRDRPATSGRSQHGDERHVRDWHLRVGVPSDASPSGGDLLVHVGGRTFAIPYEVSLPLRTEWRLESISGRPYAVLDVSDLSRVGGELAYDLIAPWLKETSTGSAELAAGGRVSLRLPLPLDQPEGHEAELRLTAALEVAGYRGSATASMPVLWSGATPGSVKLDRVEQALVADRPWAGPADASAEASVSVGPDAIRIACRVHDDEHVVDGNADDLYENDSLQVYLDFRHDHHGDRNFSPGVAAYLFAPNAAKDSVTVKQIAGNREISNRGATAAWFTTEGVQATCRPAPDGYEIEVFLPYASMGVRPLQAGDVIGFDLSLSDNDGTWYRNTQLLWSGSRGRRCYIRGSYHDPVEFGWLVVSGISESRRPTSGPG